MNAKEASLYLKEWGVEISPQNHGRNKYLFVMKGKKKMFSHYALDEYVLTKKELTVIDKAAKELGLHHATLLDYVDRRKAPHEMHFGKIYFDIYELKKWYKNYLKNK